MEDRVRWLESEIRKASESYYNNEPRMYPNKEGELVEANPMSDAEFDELVDELQELDPNSPVLSEVGAAPSWGKKVKHDEPMGSLKKVTTENLSKWFQELEFSHKKLLAGPKIDGLAISLKYRNGKLAGAATRGDGEIGQDVLENAKRIGSVPQKLHRDFTGEVRGEVYMKKSVFKELNKELELKGAKLLANPRNGAAGGLLQKDPEETAKKRLDFMGYSLREEGVEIDSEQRSQAICEGLGFEYVEWSVVDPVHLEANLIDWQNRRRPELDYQIDGVVFTIDSLEDQKEAGAVGNRPVAKIAWKFPPEQREATVLGYKFQVGRTGKATPVVMIEPTHIDGSTVSKASVGSFALFKKLGLGRGDKVLIQKAGDIIPQVVKVTWRPRMSPKIEAPTTCPCCSHALVEEGANLFCKNNACESRLRRRILHWLDKMDVKGVGPSNVASMCDDGLVSKLSDLYFMDGSELAESLGSEKIASGIMEEIMTKSEMPFWRFLSGLGVPSLGDTASKSIAKKYNTVEEIVEAEVEGLSSIDGIGEITAKQIIEGLIDMAADIEILLTALEVEEPVTGGPLSGLTFCLTGKMSRDRKEIAKDIEKAGGEVKGSVGKGLNFLVQADPTSTSSKTKKADKYGTKVIGEEELMEMIV